MLLIILQLNFNISLIVRIKYYRFPQQYVLKYWGKRIAADVRSLRSNVTTGRKFSFSPPHRGKIVALFIASWNRKLGQDNYVPRKIFFFRPLNYFHPGRSCIIYADVLRECFFQTLLIRNLSSNLSHFIFCLFKLDQPSTIIVINFLSNLIRVTPCFSFCYL